MKEVEFSTLGMDEDGRMLEGEELFSGIAVERWPGGELASRMSFLDGIQDGWSRGWHRNGVAESEAFYREGGVVGVRREWYSNGQLKLEAEIEEGTCLWKKEWSETGDLVNNYVLPEDHPEYKMLQRWRSEKSG